MDIIGTMIIILAGFFLIVFSFWITFSGVIEDQMRRRERIKRKKGQSFKEGFLYSRFKMEIPKSLLYLYYSLIFLHLAAVLSILFIYLLYISSRSVDIVTIFIRIVDMVAIFIGIGDMVIISTLMFIFSSPKRSQFIVGRWIKKDKKR